MDLSELKTHLEEDLGKRLIRPPALLSRFRVMDEASRLAPAYVDDANFPFYYHLGKYLQPTTMFEWGFELGFRSACFLQSCSTATYLHACENAKKEYFAGRLACKNLRDVYKKDFKFEIIPVNNVLEALDSTFDLAFINDDLNYDEYRNVFDAVFEHMRLNGIVVVGKVLSNSVCGDAFSAFCKIQHREPMIIETRYGTGIVQR
jgi:predicted O-methyltransferase YrrM